MLVKYDVGEVAVCPQPFGSSRSTKVNLFRMPPPRGDLPMRSRDFAKQTQRAPRRASVAARSAGHRLDRSRQIGETKPTRAGAPRERFCGARAGAAFADSHLAKQSHRVPNRPYGACLRRARLGKFTKRICEIPIKSTTLETSESSRGSRFGEATHPQSQPNVPPFWRNGETNEFGFSESNQCVIVESADAWSYQSRHLATWGWPRANVGCKGSARPS